MKENRSVHRAARPLVRFPFSSVIFNRKVPFSRAFQSEMKGKNGSFHETCWGAMVDRKIFSPAALSQSERSKLRHKFTFGSPESHFCIILHCFALICIIWHRFASF